VVAALNVKTAIFFLAFLPQFVDPDRAALAQVLPLGATFVAMGMVTNLGWAALSGAAAGRLRGAGFGRARRRAAGGICLGLAAVRALSAGRS
jgi:threonine/homoserine/homoserine lactone efflux protein